MVRSIGVVVLLLGIAALIYGVLWHKDTVAEAELGPVRLEVEEKQRPNLPIWGGLVGIATGAGLLVLATRRR